MARLAAHEHWALAAYVARRCARDPRDVWERWAAALILCAAPPLAFANFARPRTAWQLCSD